MPKKTLSFNGNQLDIQRIVGWKPPVFHQASECYVSVTAYDPSIGKMRMKKIMLGHIKGKRQQRIYGMEIIKKLTEKLLNGWNPWVEVSHPAEYALFSDVCTKYEAYLNKLVKEGGIRPGTARNYSIKLTFLKAWVNKNKINITYVYQFDKTVVAKFLDYIFVERNNTLRTRNNYVGWLKSFSRYLMERNYVNSDPTLGIRTTTKLEKKGRNVIPDDVLVKIKTHLVQTNKHFLLVCYMLHYLFIRPHEMIFIKIKDISLKNKTVILSGNYTKNGKDSVITLPNHVIDLLQELKIFSYPSDYYIFGKKFRPGVKKISEGYLSKYWHIEVQEKLGIDKSYKFYSLKDTGITNMIKAHTDLLSVRDQARHSSVSVTNVYTPSEIKKANEQITDYEGVF